MEVNVKIRDGVIILKPNGKIIGIAGGELRQVMEAQLKDASESPRFLLDFVDVPLMDSIGLGTLLAFYESVTQKGGRIGVINLNNALNNLLAMVNLITIFEHFDSEAEAIAELQGREHERS